MGMMEKIDVINFRELGGIKARDGRTVRKGLFFRGGPLQELDEGSKKAIDELGIKHIVDLRSTREVERTEREYVPEGADYVNISGMANVDMDMLRGENRNFFEDFMEGLYRLLPFDNPAYRHLFTLIEEKEAPLYFHCSAGKDRTGVFASLLLKLLDVPEETIIDHYMISYDNMMKVLPVLPPIANMVTMENWITGMFEEIVRKYGDFDTFFLKEYGIDQNMKKEIQDYCLEEEEHMEKYILAIDQGTTSTRAIIFDKDQNAVQTAQKEITNYFPHPGWVEQDANEIWLSTLAVMADVFMKGPISPEQIAAIGISNQRETSVIWNKKTGLPVYHAIVWQSRQTDKIIEEYRKKGVETVVREKTGLVLDPYFSASKINWIEENVPGVRDNEDLIFGTIDTFLLWKMTNGKVHATDVTNASRTLLFNIHTLDWDDELLEIFHVRRSLLPEIKDTSGVFGTIDPQHFFGCSVPITALVGDQQAALFGQSCFERNDIKNTYGTGGFMLVNTGEDLIISRNGLLSTVAWKIGDNLKYALEGSIFVSGSLIQWLRDGLHFFTNAAETEALARSVPDSNGVIIVPAFVGLGAPYWNDECRGAIFGLTRGTTVAHIARASLEAMAYQSKDLTEIIEAETGDKIRKLKVDGGASENRFLLEFQSDILQIPVVKSMNKETTALGAARLAGLAVDYYSMNDFGNEETAVIEPAMDKETVDELYDRWHKAVRSCLGF